MAIPRDGVATVNFLYAITTPLNLLKPRCIATVCMRLIWYTIYVRVHKTDVTTVIEMPWSWQILLNRAGIHTSEKKPLWRSSMRPYCRSWIYSKTFPYIVLHWYVRVRHIFGCVRSWASQPIRSLTSPRRADPEEMNKFNWAKVPCFLFELPS